MKKSGIILIVTGVIAYLAPRVLLTTVLMVAGVMVSSLVRSVFKKDAFHLSAVFHKGCATVHWAFISFYLFSFDNIRTDLGFRPIEVFLFVLVFSFVLYVSGSLMTRKVLENPNPTFLTTKEEWENAWLATISLVVALLFARVLIQTAPTKTAPSSPGNTPTSLHRAIPPRPSAEGIPREISPRFGCRRHTASMAFAFFRAPVAWFPLDTEQKRHPLTERL